MQLNESMGNTRRRLSHPFADWTVDLTSKRIPLVPEISLSLALISWQNDLLVYELFLPYSLLPNIALYISIRHSNISKYP